MSLESYKSLTTYERELLWAAWGDSPWLVGLRDGIGVGQDMPVDRHRQLLAETLIALLEANLIVAALWRWPDEINDVQRLSIVEMRHMLEDGTAWDPDQELLVGITTTESGDAMLTRPDEDQSEQTDEALT